MGTKDSLEKKSLVEEEEGHRNKFEIPRLLLLFLHPKVTNLTKPQKEFFYKNKSNQQSGHSFACSESHSFHGSFLSILRDIFYSMEIPSHSLLRRLVWVTISPRHSSSLHKSSRLQSLELVRWLSDWLGCGWAAHFEMNVSQHPFHPSINSNPNKQY